MKYVKYVYVVKKKMSKLNIYIGGGYMICSCCILLSYTFLVYFLSALKKKFYL